MATYTKNKLSGSTNGMAIKVVAVATIGTTIHTAVIGTSSWDEIWLYAQNTDPVARNLTIEWGTVTTPNAIIVSIPAQSGLVLVVPGLLLQNGLLVTAFASAANVIMISGYVNSIV
jgi:hypothetical protein